MGREMPESKRKPGAQPGNTNALKHGFYSQRTRPLADRAITLQFIEGQVSGSSGCNQYQAAYEVNGDALTISQAAMTLMACTEPEGIMEQERLYLELLGSAERFQLTDEELLIYGAGDALFSFIPLP